MAGGSPGITGNAEGSVVGNPGLPGSVTDHTLVNPGFPGSSKGRSITKDNSGFLGNTNNDKSNGKDGNSAYENVAASKSSQKRYDWIYLK